MLSQLTSSSLIYELEAKSPGPKRSPSLSAVRACRRHTCDLQGAHTGHKGQSHLLACLLFISSIGSIRSISGINGQVWYVQVGCGWV